VSRAELNDGVWRLLEVFESDENGIKLNGAVASGNKSNEIKAAALRRRRAALLLLVLKQE